MTSAFLAVRRYGRSLAALVIAPVIGCGMINVNGKPLGGGTTSSSGGGAAASSGDGEQAASGPASSSSSGASSGGGGQVTEGRPASTRKLEDVAAPDPKAPLATWTAEQQWMPYLKWGADYGYVTLAGGVALADELGDRLSQLGRASFVEKCFHNAKDDASSALMWAVCGRDVAALDLKALDAEIAAAGVGPASHDEVVKHVREQLDAAKKVGAAVEAAAKDDPGVAALLRLGADAREEWKAYAASHADQVAKYLALKDAVRSGKSNDKGYQGCYEVTQPAFAKAVRATKFPTGVHGDPLPARVELVTQTIDGYVAAVAYGACAFGQAPSGEALYAAAANPKGGGARFGARSVTLAKILSPAFKPSFADRSLQFHSMAFEWQYGLTMPGANAITAIMTPGGGVVGSIKPDGDAVHINFKGNSVEECLEWQDTNRIAQVTPNGSISYQKVCKQRGRVANQASGVTTSAKFLGGIAVGAEIITVDQFPVAAWKGKKLTGVLGIALN